MVIGHEKDLFALKMDSPAVKDASMKTLISPDEGWVDNVMRVVELEEGGHSPKHTHDWPHINYVLEGEGVIYKDGEETAITVGSYAYIPSNELHQFRNTGKGKLRFICIVPIEGHK